MSASSASRSAASIAIGLVAAWAGACYERPATLGLRCEVDGHCDAAQICEDGRCRAGVGASAGLACSDDGDVACGYGECLCPLDAPFCCGDGRCYDDLDGCADAFAVPECPGGGDCSVCRVLDELVDFCPTESPYCCFENGPAGSPVYCNSDPLAACGE